MRTILALLLLAVSALLCGQSRAADKPNSGDVNNGFGCIAKNRSGASKQICADLHHEHDEGNDEG